MIRYRYVAQCVDTFARQPQYRIGRAISLPVNERSSASQPFGGSWFFPAAHALQDPARLIRRNSINQNFYIVNYQNATLARTSFEPSTISLPERLAVVSCPTKRSIHKFCAVLPCFCRCVVPYPVSQSGFSACIKRPSCELRTCCPRRGNISKQLFRPCSSGRSGERLP